MFGGEYFTITYVIDTIPNSPASYQLSTKAKKTFWIIAINGEEPITTQGEIDNVINPRSISVHAEERYNRGQILD